MKDLNQIREIGTERKPFSLSGLLMAVDRDEQPAWLQFPGQQIFTIPLFTDLKALLRFMNSVPYPHHKLMQIQDGREFLQSIGGLEFFNIIVNPWVTEDRKTRFTGIFASEGELIEGQHETT